MRKIVSHLALLTTVACTTAAHTAPTPARYSVVLTHARIVDGTGNPWYYGDIAIAGDRIVAIEPHLRTDDAARVIDATGMVVAPGFIDMLGHSEYAILGNPHAVSKITQGITSEITGEVESAWPNTTPASRAADAPRKWASLDAYFRYIESAGTAINIGTYVTAGSVRRAVIGDASRHPTVAEMKEMGTLVDWAMNDGAMGLSTGLIYPPTTFFSTDELIALTRHASPYGGGYASHIRSEGDGLLDAIREAIHIGNGAGTWVEIRHLKSHTLAQMQQAIALIDSARAAGMDVTVDQYPYTASGTGLSAILPSWVQAGGTDSMLARLRDTAVRTRLRATMHDSSNLRGAAFTMVAGVRSDSLRQYSGKRLDEVGRMRRQDPYDAAYDILLADRGTTSAMYFTWNEDALKLVLQQPWASVGQDAGAALPDSTGGLPGSEHPRAFGTFPRILGHYVRDESVIPLETAVRKMTSLAAQRVGLRDRGLLRPGMYADVVVFDPATITDNATFERPQQLSTGVRYVFVNGAAVVDSGRVTSALPGRGLRGPGYRR
ncbi:MAG TPA: D-aminoacylase [Candidatus Elarobacter sp.]|nr:D-aminoacylase [Candidatus Elarobacter sp.]